MLFSQFLTWLKYYQKNKPKNVDISILGFLFCTYILFLPYIIIYPRKNLNILPKITPFIVFHCTHTKKSTIRKGKAHEISVRYFLIVGGDVHGVNMA